MRQIIPQFPILIQSADDSQELFVRCTDQGRARLVAVWIQPHPRIQRQSQLKTENHLITATKLGDSRIEHNYHERMNSQASLLRKQHDDAEP